METADYNFLPSIDSEAGLANKKIIRAKAPVRISFAGGGTDFPHWYKNQVGATLCTTIDQYARVSLYPRDDQEVRIHSVDLGYVVSYPVNTAPQYDGVLDLAKASIRRLGVSRGMDLDVHTDAPAGSGLGGSSALTGAVIGAAAAYENKMLDLYELSELNYVIEREDLKIPGGMQDQYATTFGGFNLIEFHANRVVVNPLRIDPSILNDLESHLLLCYTGQVRLHQGLIEKQIRFYEDRRGTAESMKRICELAFEMKEALLKGKLALFGQLLHQGFVHKKGMNPEITTGTNADILYEAARDCGATGGKLLGAGGGGYLVLYCETHRQHQVTKELAKLGGRFTNFSFEKDGLQVWRTRCL